MKMKSDLEIQFDVENVDTASCTRRGPRDVSLLSSVFFSGATEIYET